ncbi:uncharacterized protein BYT42DRAFT_561070 [Radiomyces spectabilis]|uniref:uncharacterized protein n=1 Tax=Radiomyces spectabilis TaxID=64574 RepID=UPI00221EF89D|nr:uncharacterized protein BYT42DRAFT_561070 [Radiomyces spectabilis]KAI8388743.1 hypothetical protein BYT42DRAFT_561070 [Radiomyces spectabilis]
MIEWQYPQDIDLDGIEYQALCSGLHHIDSDIIYFSKEPYVGVSVFRQIPSETERGAMMKSMGAILKPSSATGMANLVSTHIEFLTLQLQNLMAKEVEDKVVYDRLIQYHKTYSPPDNLSTESSNDKHSARNQIRSFPRAESLSVFMSQSVNRGFDDLSTNSGPVTSPAGSSCCFPSFVHQFGPDVFVLWKAMLLRKRVLFSVQPPMEAACHYVYNTSVLSGDADKSSAESFFGGKEDFSVHPLFSVGVHDIPQLENARNGYVACTSDAIFQSKTNLYDVFIQLEPICNSTQGKLRKNQQPLITKQRQPSPHPPTNRPTIQSFSSAISSSANAADIIRFRLMQHVLHSQSEKTGYAQMGGSELTFDAVRQQRGIKIALQLLMLEAYYRWYGENIWVERPMRDAAERSDNYHQHDNRKQPYSWQRLFAGGSGKTKYQRGTLLGNVASTDDEQQDLLSVSDMSLLIADEQDAVEINNSDVFGMTAAQSSENHNQKFATEQFEESRETSQQAVDMEMSSKYTAELLTRFFQRLSSRLLSLLHDILQANEEESIDMIIIYPRDMVQLGLDPSADAQFIQEVSQLYFSKQVCVAGCLGAKPCYYCTKDKIQSCLDTCQSICSSQQNSPIRL